MTEPSSASMEKQESNNSHDESSTRRPALISFDSATKTQPLAVHKKSDIAAPAPILKTKQPVINTEEEDNAKIQAMSNLRCPSPPPILNKPSSQPGSSSAQSLNNNKLSPVSQQPPSSTTPSIRSHTPQQQQQLPSILVQSNPGSPGSGKPQFADDPKSPASISSVSSMQVPLQPTSSSSLSSNQQQQQQQQQSTQKDTIPAGGAILRGRAAAQAVVAAVLALTARDRNNRESPLSSRLDTAVSDNEDALSEVNLQINEQQFQHHKAPSMHAHFYVDETLRHGPITLSSRSRSGSGSTNESRNISEQLQLDSNHNFVKKTKEMIVQPPPVLNKTTSQIPVVTKQTIDARLPSDDNKLHVLFGICGTVSTKKTRLIINKLEEIYGPEKISIQIIITSAAEHFVSRGEFPTSVQIWRDKDEWTTWGGRSDPVLHIELRRWADILVIAPLTSNTLSKIALGLCDNLLTNVVRAWNTQYPILVAPSMVSYAYNSPITKRHLKVIKEEMKWIEILKPTEKVVGSYGDIGMGGMMDWNEIVKTICVKAQDLGFNDDEEEEEDDEEEEEEENEDDSKRNGEHDEDEDEDDENEDEEEDDDDDNIKISVAEEDEIEKVLKK